MNTITIMIMSGVEDGKLYTFDPKTLNNRTIQIGRAANNDIIITTDPAISRLHTLIFWEGGTWWLHDNTSKNGTFIERDRPLERDERIRDKVRLENGQLFRIGKTWMRFQTVAWDIHA